MNYFIPAYVIVIIVDKMENGKCNHSWKCSCSLFLWALFKQQGHKMENDEHDKEQNNCVAFMQ